MFQIFHIAILISKYKVDHTGANTQLGGLKLGKIISEYQGSLKLMVAKPPTKEAEKEMIRKNINVKSLFLIMLLIHIKK